MLQLKHASGAQKRAEQHILHALEALQMADIPVAAWRVHAIAWEVYRVTDPSKAEIERAKAQSVVLQIAESLEDFELLRECFLSANPVRRVLGEATETTAPSPMSSNPGRRSRVSAS